MALLAAFLVAFVISLVFLPYRQGSVSSLIVFFILLFMAAVSSQLWLPFGPSYYGVTWLAMLITVLVVAALASLPARKKRADEADQETATMIAESMLTWVLFGLLIVSIAIGAYTGGIW